ncbi:MFS transporter [Siminovitchia sp. FSL H7-0308]|uniref:CynX/NimT family MFS transporter n=1 Tax=unclassified Siminovitchia TaxID=2837530 RepID=UPI0030CAAF76
MNEFSTMTKQAANQRVFLVCAIIFIAFNLRPAITSVGPLVSSIRTDLGMSNGVAGMLTTLPLLAFAALSPFAPIIGRKLGNELAILIGIGLLAAGIIIRSSGSVGTLFFGTVLIGIGIAIGNVLLPGIVKLKFPDKASFMTGVYTTSLGIFAALASGLSVPLSENLGWGWKNALLAWALLAVIASVVWLPLTRKQKEEKGKIHIVRSNGSLFRSKLAWQVTFFMGLQSFLFYSLITWIPEIAYSHGFSRTMSGWMLSILQFAGLPASFIAPVIAGKLQNQRGIVLVIGSIYLIAYSGLLAGGGQAMLTVCIILLGFAQGAGFSMALTFFVLRAKDVMDAARLSGMAQSLGYLMSAIGPMLIGYELDLTQSWTLPIITLMGVVCGMTLAGIGAGKNKYVL